MIHALLFAFSQADFNDKALDILTAAGRNVAESVAQKYKGDADFREVSGSVGVGFQHKDLYANTPIPGLAWKCETEEQRTALKAGIMKKVLPLFKDYYIEQPNFRKERGTQRIWQETVHINQKVDGYPLTSNFVSFIINYQTGVLLSGHSCFAFKPLRTKITVTDEIVRKRVEQDGKTDRLEIIPLWERYNTIFGYKGSEEHRLDVVLVYFANVMRGRVQTAYYFDQEGGVQTEYELKPWKSPAKKPPII